MTDDPRAFRSRRHRPRPALSLAPALALLLLGGCAGPGGGGGAGGPDGEDDPGVAAAEAVGGVWSVEGVMGDVRVPGRLEIVPGLRGGAGGAGGEPPGGSGPTGRLTFDLPTPVHMALRWRGMAPARGDTLLFATSSPGAGARLVARGDSLEGSVALTGGRTLSLTGRRLGGAAPDPSWAREQRALSPWLRGAGPLAGWGLAFPTFHPDGSRLWVSAYHEDFGRQEIWEMVLRGDRWEPSRRVLGRGEWSDRSPRVTPDGRRLLFASDRPHRAKRGSGYDLWEAELGGDGNPGEPRPLPEPVNGPSDDHQPHPLPDGGLLFVSGRSGGPGDGDVWRAERSRNGWTVRPEGSPPNTPEAELSMWVSDDGERALVVTVAAAPGASGGDDLRWLRLSDAEDGAWEDVGPAPAPVNSFANDLGPTVSPDGRWLVFSSDRLPPAALYRVPLDSAAPPTARTTPAATGRTGG